MIFYGNIVNNQFLPLKELEYKKTLTQPDWTEVQVEIKPRERKRTNQQNRYLHQLFTILRKEFNNMGNQFTDETVKNLCKCKFLTYTEVDKQTDVYLGENIRHTSSLSTIEMNEFIEKIKAWAAEFDIYLPDPNEQMKIIE